MDSVSNIRAITWTLVFTSITSGAKIRRLELRKCRRAAASGEINWRRSVETLALLQPLLTGVGWRRGNDSLEVTGSGATRARD